MPTPPKLLMLAPKDELGVMEPVRMAVEVMDSDAIPETVGEAIIEADTEGEAAVEGVTGVHMEAPAAAKVSTAHGVQALAP